jgi:MoxR-like ATPase
MVIATQNPIEHEGTYPLPFAQLDRFLMRIGIGYPSTTAEIEVLHRHGDHSALEDVRAVCDAKTIRQMINSARKVHIDESLHEYIVSVVASTRAAPELSLGASPRAALAILRASRVAAAAAGRAFVTPDDVKALTVPVVAHRLLAAPEAEMSGRTAEDVLRDLIDEVPLRIGR